MAMIKCRECGKEISSRAENCPHCGYKTRYGRSEAENKNSSVMAIVMLVLIVVGLIMVFVNVSTFIDDTDGWGGYTYTAPLTDHEMGVVVGFAVGAGLLGGGVAGLWNMNKNKKQ